MRQNIRIFMFMTENIVTKNSNISVYLGYSGQRY